jgi:hypothetical protein
MWSYVRKVDASFLMYIAPKYINNPARDSVWGFDVSHDDVMHIQHIEHWIDSLADSSLWRRRAKFKQPRCPTI